MIACVSPGSNSSDYSLNTLYYANMMRGKSKKLQNSTYNNAVFEGQENQLNSGSKRLQRSSKKSKRSLVDRSPPPFDGNIDPFSGSKSKMLNSQNSKK